MGVLFYVCSGRNFKRELLFRCSKTYCAVATSENFQRRGCAARNTGGATSLPHPKIPRRNCANCRYCALILAAKPAGSLARSRCCRGISPSPGLSSVPCISGPRRGSFIFDGAALDPCLGPLPLSAGLRHPQRPKDGNPQQPFCRGCRSSLTPLTNVAINNVDSVVYGRDDGARTRDLCRDRSAFRSNSLKR